MALTAIALTTVPELESELGVTPGTEVRALERAIMAASAEVARVAGRALHRVAGAVDRVKGYGGARLVLPRAPVVSIASIAELADDGTVSETYDATSYELESAEAGIVYRAIGWPWTLTAASGVDGGGVAGSERASLRVTYTAGWITPWQADPAYPGGALGTRDLPWDLEDAVIQAAVTRYRGRGRDAAVKSERLGEEAVTYADVSQGGSWLPPAAYRVAQAYRGTL